MTRVWHANDVNEAWITPAPATATATAPATSSSSSSNRWLWTTAVRSSTPPSPSPLTEPLLREQSSANDSTHANNTSHTGIEDDRHHHRRTIDTKDDIEANATATTTTGTQNTKDNSAAEELLLYSTWDYLCLWLILPSLLTVQFAMALEGNNINTDDHTTPNTAPLSLTTTVLPLIALFVVTGFLYKQCLRDTIVWQRHQQQHQHQPTGAHCHSFISSFWTPPESVWSVRMLQQQTVLLLPEIIMDVVLGLILCVSAPAAVLTLLLATMALSALCAVHSLAVLVALSSSSKEDENEASVATATADGKDPSSIMDSNDDDRVR